jgi:hypothetical protein
MIAYGFQNLKLPFVKEIQIEVSASSLASMKYFTNCEIPSSNPLQGACSG